MPRVEAHSTPRCSTAVRAVRQPPGLPATTGRGVRWSRVAFGHAAATLEPTEPSQQPWDSTLYQVVRDNVATLYQASEDGFGSPLPGFVRAELSGYLGCRVLGRGFAHLVCKDCGQPHLLAFSCGGRGFCPSCTGRTMAQTAANLTEFVLPDAPLRQWVLTVPFALRAAVAYDRHLLPRLYGFLCDSIQGFYRRRLADHGYPGGRTGSVTAIQRCSGDLRLNPHLHGVFLDGVYVEHTAAGSDAQAALRFVTLPQPTDMDVKEVLQTLVARAARYLRRRGLLTDDDSGAALQPRHDQDSEQLALDALAQAAATGTSIAGPASRKGRIALQDGELARSRSPLCATLSGFSLHARTTVEQGDKAGRERLIKYILRPPLAEGRLQRLDGGRVRLQLKRAFGDGTFAVEMDELSLVARLAAMVPPPWQNQVRYSGVLAPAAKWRCGVVATAPSADDATAALWQGMGLPPSDADSPQPALPKGKGCRYWPWRYLKARSFGEQTASCPSCQGPLRLRAFVHDTHSIHRIRAETHQQQWEL